jgi:hypothetical protein
MHSPDAHAREIETVDTHLLHLRFALNAIPSVDDATQQARDLVRFKHRRNASASRFMQMR